MEAQSWDGAGSPLPGIAFLPINHPRPEAGYRPGAGSRIPAGSQQQIGTRVLSNALKILSGESGERKKWLRFSEIKGVIITQPL